VPSPAGTPRGDTRISPQGNRLPQQSRHMGQFGKTINAQIESSRRASKFLADLAYQ